MPLIFMCFPAPYTRAASHTQTAPSNVNSPHASARLSPCWRRSPIRFYGSPIQSPSSKNPTPISTRPAFPAPQIRHPQVSTNSLRRLLERYRMSGRGIGPPRPAAGSPRSTHPTGSRIFPATKGGGSGNALHHPARPCLHRPGFTAIHACRIRSGPQKWGITNPPRPAAGSPRIHASNRFTHLPCNKGGWLWQCAAPPARPCLHRPGFTAIHACRIRSGPQKWGITNPPRPARPVHSNLRANPVHSDSPVQRLGGMDDGVAATCRRQGGPAPACMIRPKGPITVEPLGSTAVRPEGRTVWST